MGHSKCEHCLNFFIDQQLRMTPYSFLAEVFECLPECRSTKYELMLCFAKMVTPIDNYKRKNFDYTVP